MKEAKTRWKTLAKQLLNAYDQDGGVPDWLTGCHNLDDLQHQHGSDDKCLQAVVEEFLRANYMIKYQPSWRAVIWSLYMANEIELGDSIKSYAEPLQATGVLHMYECVYILANPTIPVWPICEVR